MDRGARAWRSELTPVAFLERSASVFRERTAVIDGKSQHSYAEHGERVQRLMGALHGRSGAAARHPLPHHPGGCL